MRNSLLTRLLFVLPSIVGIVLSGCGNRDLDIRRNDRSSSSEEASHEASWLLTADYLSGGLTMNRVSEDGHLTITSQGVVPSRVNASFMGLTPNKKFVYVPHEDGTLRISGFSIDPQSGELSSIPGSPFEGAGTRAAHALVHPSGKFLYSQGSNTLKGYSISATTGALTDLGFSVNLVSGAYQMTMDPLGRYLFATSYAGGKIYSYLVNSITGALTAAAGSPYTNPDGSIHGVAADPTGAFLAVASAGIPRLHIYSIHSITGVLTHTHGPIALTDTRWLTFAPSGKFLVAAGGSTGLHIFKFDAGTGLAVEVAGSPYAEQGDDIWFATFDPSGGFLYATDINHAKAYAYAVDANSGALTALSPGGFDLAKEAYAMLSFTTVY